MGTTERTVTQYQNINTDKERKILKQVPISRWSIVIRPYVMVTQFPHVTKITTTTTNENFNSKPFLSFRFYSIYQFRFCFGYLLFIASIFTNKVSIYCVDYKLLIGDLVLFFCRLQFHCDHFTLAGLTTLCSHFISICHRVHVWPVNRGHLHFLLYNQLSERKRLDPISTPFSIMTI